MSQYTARSNTERGQVNDGGPSQGYRYVTKVSDRNEDGRTRFTFRIHPDLKNEQSEFFRAQCGNYHPVTSPNGFIGVAQLRRIVLQHEGGTEGGSHYLNYRIAQDDDSNNIRAGAEAALQLGGTDEAFREAVAAIVTARFGRIDAANRGPGGEPCDGLAEKDGSTADCIFNGQNNFDIEGFGFQSCDGN